MNNLEYAKERLNGNTVCLVKGNHLFTSQKHGITPLVEFIDSGIDFTSFSAADRIVGKAAAFLYASMGVKEVYAEVLSKEAILVFEKYNILFEYKVLTDNIINRKGNGLCPMEETVFSINSKEEALYALKNKLKEL